MRIILIISVLLAAPLGAQESEPVDDTLRLARHVLLREAVREHMNLPDGTPGDLDDAVEVDITLDGRKRTVVALRHETRACVAILDVANDECTVSASHLLEVEGKAAIHAAAGGIVLTSEVDRDEEAPHVTQRARFLQLDGDDLTVVHTFDSRSEQAFAEEDYEIITTARISGTEDAPLLTITTEYRQDEVPIAEGTDIVRWKLVDSPEGMIRNLDKASDFGVSTHTGLARRLEREGLENAALHHARAACQLAEDEKLDAEDPRRQEAVALATKLEARLRDEVVEN